MIPFIYVSRHGDLFSVDEDKFKKSVRHEKPDGCRASKYVDVALAIDGTIYIGCFGDIYRLDPGSNSPQPIYSLPKDSGYIRKIAVRGNHSHEVIYFSVDPPDPPEMETDVIIYRLVEDDHAVHYYTIDQDELLIPNPCPPYDEIHSFLYGPGLFAFDDNNNLFISNGWITPGAFYRVSGAGENEVSGDLERILLLPDEIHGGYDLECFDSNVLYCLYGGKIRRIDLVPFHMEVVYDTSDDQDFCSEVAGFSLDRSISHWQLTDEIRWIQRVLPKIFPLKFEVDGVYGPKTRKAVLEFQQMHGLKADSIVGPKTKAKLIEVLKQKYEQKGANIKELVRRNWST